MSHNLFRHILNMNTQEQTPAVYTGCERAARAVNSIYDIGCNKKELAALSWIIANEAAAPAMYEALVAALPYVEMCDHDEAYKKGVVSKIVNQMLLALAAARKGGAL